MPERRRTALHLLAFAAALLAWAYLVEPAVTLPVWGDLPWGVAFCVAGVVLAVSGLAHPELARWFPRPIYTGAAVLVFGIAMLAGSRAGLWLIAPGTALCGAALAAAGFGVRHPLLPPDSDASPTFLECIRFWFACAVPWIAIYEFTVHMRLPGRAFQFEFEDNLPIYPVTSLLYQSTYLAVTVAPFLARTQRELRQLTISAWVATLFVFPFYWLVPSTAPRRPMAVDGWLARLLSFERNTYPPSAAFPSFHVLWSIFIGRLICPAALGWLYVLGVAVSCITTGMHYIPDVLVSFVLAPLFMGPQRWLNSPARRWIFAYVMLGFVLLCIAIRTQHAGILAGVALLGVFLLELARRGKAPVE